jgi:hypothetical protein
MKNSKEVYIQYIVNMKKKVYDLENYAVEKECMA